MCCQDLVPRLKDATEHNTQCANLQVRPGLQWRVHWFICGGLVPANNILKKIRIASTLAANNLPESCSYHFRSAMIDAKNPLASLSVDPPGRCYITNLFTCTAALSFRKRELFAVLIVK